MTLNDPNASLEAARRQLAMRAPAMSLEEYAEALARVETEIVPRLDPAAREAVTAELRDLLLFQAFSLGDPSWERLLRERVRDGWPDARQRAHVLFVTLLYLTRQQAVDQVAELRGWIVDCLRELRAEEPDAPLSNYARAMEAAGLPLPPDLVDEDT